MTYGERRLAQSSPLQLNLLFHLSCTAWNYVLEAMVCLVFHSAALFDLESMRVKVKGRKNYSVVIYVLYCFYGCLFYHITI